MDIEFTNYHTDLPDDCWSAEIGGETLYLYAERGEDGRVEVSVNHGYELGTAFARDEQALFDCNRKALQAAAETAVAELEASRLPSPRA